MLFLNGEQFISAATGVDVDAGRDLESWASGIDIIKMSLHGSNIVFVEMPGFDDPKNDSATLEMIATWLEITYVFSSAT